MSIFEKKQDISSIRAIPEEVSVQIINSIYRQIYNIDYHIRDGENMSENEWPAFMGMRKAILSELRDKQMEYRKFLRESITILFSYDDDNNDINYKSYLRAFNNFMTQMQEDAEKELAVVRAQAFAKNREYFIARENAIRRRSGYECVQSAENL